MNSKLKQYIEDNILIKYEENNIGGHDRKHIKYVIDRIFELNQKFNLKINPNMFYVIAAYHDIVYAIDANKREEISCKLFFQWWKYKKFFQ